MARQKNKTVPATESKPIETVKKVGSDNCVGRVACTPFGQVPIIEDLGDKVTVEYADKTRKVFPKSEVTIN